MDALPIEIRRARADEAPALARFAAQAFTAAFAAANRPEHLAAYLARAYGESQQARELADPGWITLLALRAGGLVGYAQVRASAAPSCVTQAGAVELYRFYVDAALHGTGLARRLMARACAAARLLGGRSLWLGVWEHNPRAIAFYRKMGLEDVGVTHFDVGPDRQNDRVMVRPLARAGDVVSLLLWDLDGVLYDFLPERRLAYLADLTGLAPADIHAAVWTGDFEPSAEAGDYTSGADYLAAFNQRLGHALSPGQWQAARARAMRPRADVLAVLAAQRARVDLAVLTNNGALFRDSLAQLVPDLHALLGAQLHVSCEFGARKPQPEVFARLLAHHALPADSVLFIDDVADNVAAARAVGLQALLFESAAQVAAELDSRLQSSAAGAAAPG